MKYSSSTHDNAGRWPASSMRKIWKGLLALAIIGAMPISMHALNVKDVPLADPNALAIAADYTATEVGVGNLATITDFTLNEGITTSVSCVTTKTTNGALVLNNVLATDSKVNILATDGNWCNTTSPIANNFTTTSVSNTTNGNFLADTVTLNTGAVIASTAGGTNTVANTTTNNRANILNNGANVCGNNSTVGYNTINFAGTMFAANTINVGTVGSTNGVNVAKGGDNGTANKIAVAGLNDVNAAFLVNSS